MVELIGNGNRKEKKTKEKRKRKRKRKKRGLGQAKEHGDEQVVDANPPLSPHDCFGAGLPVEADEISES